MKPSEQHIKPAAKPAGAPPPLAIVPTVEPPKPKPRQETYSVVVNNVPARDVLFALARDAKIDIDIAGDIEGTITLNALNQSLPQLLDRISRQIDMRWEMEGKTLQITRDTPFLRNYKVDYVNLARQSTSSVNVATQVTGAVSAGSGGGTATSTAGNASLTNVITRSDNDFWTTLIDNVRDLLRETDRILPEGSYEQTQEASNTQQTTGTGAPAPTTARGTTTPSLATSPNPAAMQTLGTTMVRRSTFREAASVIANRETGLIAVRATARQHDKIREFMDRVLNNARRQVLIEATIVEVTLNDQSQTGVDWKSVALASGFTFRQNLLGTALDKGLPDSTRTELLRSIMGSNLTDVQKSNLIQQFAPGMGTLGDPGNLMQGGLLDTIRRQVDAGILSPTDAAAAYQQAAAVTAYGGVLGSPGATIPTADTRFTGGIYPLTSKNAGMTIGYGKGSSFAAAMSLLSQYGRTKVISSPKITALNNQSAVLRVVDNLVYFTINAQITPGAAGAAPVSVYTSTANTVAVGFVMNVIPQIDDGNQVTLTVRPTISRLKGYAQDPNPVLRDTPNLVPIVQTKEMESVMKVPSGNVVMMGGLMEDMENRGSEGLPTLGDLPGVGRLFSTRNSQTGKTELVIFLRPVVITDPSLEGDYEFAKDLLPGKEFFNRPLERKIPMATSLPSSEQTP